ncbi:SnoaL-like domain-containing protein [Pseudarcicella hirudinis]|uniref:SnoaL-like domain-containing protein n=1 Tax=Pseudarcicella hirudinis TaxID=1079859 RepID=A0A1I5RKX1_9BACT|nr:nuclear transport factor 2 family protein [Pseudarcicella hirudinis]SFP59188.1 SnoaL-like domain-containing protein [Pseudarcicella hirudinis]
MITQAFADEFARHWVASWNTHNLDNILEHYSEDFSIETPMALRLLPQTEGKLQGKDAIRAYWKIGLERIPDLEFELLDLLLGINGLTIYYFNKATGKKSVEIMFFNEQMKVHKVFVHYS